MNKTPSRWRLGLGAEVYNDGVRFRLWAPKAQHIEVVLDETSASYPLQREADGYFSTFIPDLPVGTLYRYRVNGGQAYPDPCSRFQPHGPHGPSMVVDPYSFSWHDATWPGMRMPGHVIYEMHIGTFTPAGTFDSACAELAELQRIGITLLEVMPVAEFPGRWNWGYDGVDLYAPTHNYGDAHALRRFVDAAHQLGLGVILDVVYNHLGPDGNYLGVFSDAYFTSRYTTDWGAAINYDGVDASQVREFFLRNACYWISEFHLDGLRLDATQNIYDCSTPHILAELSERTRAVAYPRTIVLIAENEPQDVTCITPVQKGGYGLDAIWNDDFHHSARVAFTGRREAYYTDYYGQAQEWLSTIKRGFLYQGQQYQWQQQSRGTVVTDEPASAFIIFTQNHDQIANTLHGERLSQLTSPAHYRAFTALMLLAPQTPMLFMGQEFGATTPFLFFCDYSDNELVKSIHQGRREFLAQFPSYGSPEAQAAVPNPCVSESLTRSRLDLSQRERYAYSYTFHQDLLRLRREDPLIARQARHLLDGAVLGAHTLILRFFSHADDEDRLLLVNLDLEFSFQPAPEPLLAPPPAKSWQLVWSSDDPRYGGPGIVHPCQEGSWLFPGANATLLRAQEKAQQ